MKIYTFIGVLLLLACTPSFAWIIFNCIEPISKTTDPIRETHYTGSGVMDLTFPCIIDKRGREVVSDFVYAVMAVDNPTALQGNMHLLYEPNGDPDMGFLVGDATVRSSGAFILYGTQFFWNRIIDYFPQYPNGVLRLTWSNPTATTWRLTVFRKGRIS